jgi:exonuclease SbcC
MIPKHLSLSGFLSYRDPVELDFTSFELACISGPNGAGKSSLLDAITFALFGQARKRDESIINSASEVAEVSFVFEYEGNTYRIQRANPRGKNTLLEFHIQNASGGWKALTERTLRDTDARIQETLRLDYETFVNASFFLQGKADQFTQQRPADRKRILSSILGLEVWEQYRQTAAERRKRASNDVSGLDGRLHEINAELAEEADRKARLKMLNTDLERLSVARSAQESALGEMRLRAAAVDQQATLVATLAAQMERSRSILEELHARLTERGTEQASHADLLGRAAEVQAAFSEYEHLRAELARWDEVAGRFNQQEKRRSEPLTKIEAERARLENELANLQTEREKLEEARGALPELNAELKLVQGEIKALELQIANKSGLEKQLEGALKDQAEARAENPLLKAEMEKLMGRIEQIQKASGAACPTCGQALTEEHRQEMVTLWTKEGTEKGDKYRSNSATLKAADQHVQELQAAIAALAGADEQMRGQARRADQITAALEEIEKNEKDWKARGLARLKEIEQALAKEQFATEARAKLAGIDAELKEIGYDAAQHDTVRARELAARSAEADLRALQSAQAASQPLEREIKELEKQIAAQEKDIGEGESAHTQAAASLAAAQAELPDVFGAERQMLTLQEEENKTRQEVGAAQQLVAVLSELRRRKKELEAEREAYTKAIGQFQALERAFGKDGVPAMLIEQALPQIETRANEVLERLSGGGMYIRFVTQREYKDNKRDDLRETLEIQISDGAGDRDYEMFSGGEAFRINFAIRLALSEVLAQRAGARLQTLVIDEGFGSQDEAGRQRLVEAINLVRPDFAKILVITHIDALKDAFPARIEVEKGPRGSTLMVV